jgi:hypothetical protein
VNEFADDGVLEPHPKVNAAAAESAKTAPNTVCLIDFSTRLGRFLGD